MIYTGCNVAVGGNEGYFRKRTQPKAKSFNKEVLPDAVISGERSTRPALSDHINAGNRYCAVPKCRFTATGPASSLSAVVRTDFGIAIVNEFYLVARFVFETESSPRHCPKFDKRS